MNGGTCQKMVCTLTIAIVLGTFASASGQLNTPLMVSADPSYGVAAEQYYPGQATDTQLVSSSSFSAAEQSLADEVADLKAWKKSIQDKEAAAKKKAAGAPTLKIGGRIFADTAVFDQNANSVAQMVPAGDMENGTEMRAAWLYFKGTAMHVVDYKLQFDLAGQTSFKDVFVQIKELPLLGNVRIGHFKEPFGMEQLESTRFTTFMERSLCDAGAFVPARNMGVMAFDCSDNERMTWAVGAFVSEQGDTPPVFQDDHEGAAVTARVTFLPWYDEATEGRGLLHTGVAYSYRMVGDQTVQFRARPEAHLGKYIVDTTALDVSDYQILGAELAYLYGPLCFQSEFFHATLDPLAAPDVSFNGCYMYVSYFLTGENRRYNRAAGTFDNRIKPFENFFRVRDENGTVQTGKGAWEVAYRYSYIDLNDGIAAGGRAADHTLGLNWYLNPYARMMFNYVHSTTDARGGIDNGVVNVLQMRAQVDF